MMNLGLPEAYGNWRQMKRGVDVVHMADTWLVVSVQSLLTTDAGADMVVDPAPGRKMTPPKGMLRDRSY